MKPLCWIKSTGDTQVSEQDAQGGCGVSDFGDTQTPTLHGPEQPPLGDPVLSRRPLPTSTILWLGRGTLDFTALKGIAWLGKSASAPWLLLTALSKPAKPPTPYNHRSYVMRPNFQNSSVYDCCYLGNQIRKLLIFWQIPFMSMACLNFNGTVFLIKNLRRWHFSLQLWLHIYIYIKHYVNIYVTINSIAHICCNAIGPASQPTIVSHLTQP